VKEVRTGGMLRHGANGYTRARKDYEKALAASKGSGTQTSGK
jgi:hypothetical protein